MVKDKKIKLDKVYKSESVEDQPEMVFDQHSEKRPSWVKIDLDKKIIFIKILFNGEAFWYRRYFEDYFFPLESNSEDTKNFYNAVAEKYEIFVPHQKEIGKTLISFLKELKMNKNSSILDLGAGTGLVAEELVHAGFKKLTLLDISREELKIAKNKELLKNAKFMESDLTKNNIDGKYDVIFETLAFNELKKEDVLSILRKIKESLNEEGVFIMIDRHLFLELDSFLKELKSGKFPLQTPAGMFDYYYFIGKK